MTGTDAGTVIDLLPRTLVRVMPQAGAGGGTGFFVAPGMVVTCAHVLGSAAAVGTNVSVVRDGGDGSTGHVVALSAAPSDHGRWPLPDLAVIHIRLPGDAGGLCVQLTDTTPPVGDDLYVVGFTATMDDAQPTLEPALFRCEGRHRVDDGDLIQLSASGHVLTGMSGAPVLHLASGRVCGVVKASRDSTTSAGGWAVSVDALRGLDAQVLARHDEFHRRDARWRESAERWSEIHQQLFEPGLPSSVLDDARTRPSVLLRADAAAVPFRGRTNLISDLEDWCTRPTTVDVRLLTGSGGTGKTRLALQLVTRLRERGWIAGFVHRDPPQEALRALVNTSTPALLVFDYAETRSLQCGDMLDYIADVERAEPFRVLLLARAAGEWWHDLTTAGPRVEALLHGSSPTDLPVLEPTREGRQEAFRSALAAFAQRLGVPLPPASIDLSDNRFGLPLDLQMTALATLLRTPGDAVALADPVDYILKHERRYWRRTAEENGLMLGGAVLERVMTAATLCRAATESEAAHLLCGVPDLAGPDPAVRHRYARWAHEVNPDPAHYLAPLQPDRLGERLVVDVLSRTPDLLKVLLTEASETQSAHALAVLFRTFRQLAHTAASPAAVGRLTDVIDKMFGDRPEIPQRLAIEQATARYAAQVTQATGTLNLPLRTSVHRMLRQSFDGLYVDLSAAPSGARPDTAESSLVDIVTVRRRILLRGPAGAGKTTFLLWLARRAADLTLRLDNDDIVPFYVPLRSYTPTRLPRPEQFIAHLVRGADIGMPTGWAHSLFQTGSALLLIDGVDELPSAQRSSAKSWLDEIVAVYPEARYIVSSRPFIPPEWLSDIGFEPFDLQPLSTSSSFHFVERWHKAVHDESDWPVAEQLKEELRRNPEMMTLAGNPLMCTLMCEVHSMTGHIPRGMIDLYAAAVDLFFSTWDQARDVTVGHRQDARSWLHALEHLAYWHLHNEPAQLTAKLAAQQIKIATKGYVKPSTPEQVLDYLLERTGLLVQTGPDSIDFVSRGMRDYLATGEIIRRGDLDILVQHAHLDNWHSAIVMAVDRAGAQYEDAPKQILHGLLQAAETNASTRDQLLLLAATCAQQSAYIGPRLRAAVLEATRR